jgi:hypothetical protein
VPSKKTQMLYLKHFGALCFSALMLRPFTNNSTISMKFANGVIVALKSSSTKMIVND